VSRILLVDDDRIQLKLSRAYLEDAGFAVVSTDSAQAAIALAREAPPDLIMSDVLMGEIDGFGLCRKLAEEPTLAAIPVVLVSAHYGGDGDRDLAKKVGAAMLVERTPNFEAELAAVQTCLSVPREGSNGPGATYEEHLQSNAKQLTRLVEQARRAELRLRMMLEYAYDTITTLTPDGIVLEANHRWKALLGIEPRDMIGRHVRDFAPPGSELANTASFLRAVEDGSKQRIVPLRHAVTGKTVFMEIATLVVMIDGQDRVMSIGRDITDKVESEQRAAAAEATRRKLEERLAHSQKMDALGQLTGGVAHDFNNVLAVIMSNACFLMEDLGENDVRRGDAEEIYVAAQRAAALTRQLLAFSRRQVLELAVIDVGTVVTSLAKMLRRLIGEDIELSMVCNTDAGRVSADVSQLEQVIVNLVVNARDAMPRGGALSIETSTVTVEERGEIAPGSYVVVSVRDTGCGMDEETKRHLFEPFFTTKLRGKGTGLGLSTSYGIVNQIGGQIVVTSEVGKGSLFEVFLPRVAAPVAVPEPVAPPVRIVGTETVLIVEDETPVRNALSRILRAHGYDVLTADGLDSAIAAMANHKRPVDLIVSDVVMPGASGPEVVRRLLVDAPRARVLFMSGYTDHPLFERGNAGGAPTFLQKPFEPETFVSSVRSTLSADARDEQRVA
jgi:two-component system cell cycle sensor histidine kinase/response regulator CckA